jgi:hypothetical protein
MEEPCEFMANAEGLLDQISESLALIEKRAEDLRNALNVIDLWLSSDANKPSLHELLCMQDVAAFTSVAGTVLADSLVVIMEAVREDQTRLF